MGFFLGVDGGSTKTYAIVANENGKIIRKLQGGGSNYYALGKKEAESNLHRIVRYITKGIRLSGACFGIAGVDNKCEYRVVYNSIKKKIMPVIKCRFILVNDVNLILYSVNHGGRGVAVISGTGSNFYAKNGKKEAYASGLGHILSDEGGAIYIGSRVLRAAVQSVDGRDRKSMLEKMVLRKAGVNNIRDLKNIISDKGHVKSVADFAPLAQKAAKKGDAVAKQILNKAADEDVKGIKAVSKRVNLNDGYDIAFVGSVFHTEYLFKRIKRRVKEFAPEANFYRVEHPALGAAKRAVIEFGK